MQLGALRQVARLVVIAQDQFAILGQLLRLRIFVHAIDRGDEAIFQFPRHRFVGREHEFLDQLVRFIVLDSLQPDRLARFIEAHFHFREIEIERAGFETAPAQERRQFPGDVQAFAQLVLRRRLQNCVGLAIGEAARAANDGARETEIARPAILPELDEDGMRQAIDVRAQAANAVAEPLRQHGNDAIGQIDAVPAFERFAIERAPGRDVGGHVGDVDAELPAAAVQAFDVDRVVEIARVVRVDRDDELLAQIFAAIGQGTIDGLGNFLRFVEHGARELERQMILPDDGKHVHAGRGAGPEDFDDFALGIDVARLPGFQPDDDFVAGAGAVDFLADVNVVHDARIVRHDVERNSSNAGACRRWCRGRVPECG